MKRTLLLIAIVAGLAASLAAAITTDPSSGIVNVGVNIGARVNCNDGCASAMFWGDDAVTSSTDTAFYNSFMYHIYRNPGTYTMHYRRYPTVTNKCPLDEYKTVTILENRRLSVAPAGPGVGQVATFTATSFNTPANITWDMGDGRIYANRGATITHTYAGKGTFQVRAYDWNGDTSSIPVTLTVTVTDPVREITYSPAAPRVDQEVAFLARNFSSASIDWNFGDGTPLQTYSTAVAHRYPNAGSFTVTAREYGTSLPTVTRVITILPENRSLSLSVPEARADEPVTVRAVNFRGPLVLWDFGDGTTASAPKLIASAGSVAGVSGPTTMTHAYRLPGNYTITARDENGASQKKFQAVIRILGISDQVNLEIAELTLDNGKYYKVVPKNSRNIRARLRMKMRGTGIVSGYWIVDGQPYQFFTETVYQGQIKMILTPEVPGLPAFDPGMHTITLQLTRPANEAVVFPTLRYFVLPFENEIAVLAPKDGAVIKEDAVATFAWEGALGASRYQIAFASSVFPLLRNDGGLKWHDCTERLAFTPDAETWGALRRNEWTYWKVRAQDSGRAIVAESGVMEVKIIVPGAEVGIRRITDMDGHGIAIGSGFTASRAERLLVQGVVTYPAAAEYLVLRVYANETQVDQLLFRDVRQGEERPFETSVPNPAGGCRVVFEVLKSSSPSLLVGFAELILKKE
jgi:PKD repeat protein